MARSMALRSEMKYKAPKSGKAKKSPAISGGLAAMVAGKKKGC